MRYFAKSAKRNTRRSNPTLQAFMEVYRNLEQELLLLGFRRGQQLLSSGGSTDAFGVWTLSNSNATVKVNVSAADPRGEFWVYFLAVQNGRTQQRFEAKPKTIRGLTKAATNAIAAARKWAASLQGVRRVSNPKRKFLKVHTDMLGFKDVYHPKGWKKPHRKVLAGGRSSMRQGVRYSRNNPAQDDPIAARELVMYVENDGTLYRQQTQPIIENLAKKKAKGVYSIELAKKLWGYLAESGAKKYAKEFSVGSDWHVMFSVPTRKLAAADLEEGFREQVFERAKEIEAAKAAKKPRSRKNAGKKNPDPESKQWYLLHYSSVVAGPMTVAAAKKQASRTYTGIKWQRQPYPSGVIYHSNTAFEITNMPPYGTKHGGRR